MFFQNLNSYQAVVIMSKEVQDDLQGGATILVTEGMINAVHPIVSNLLDVGQRLSKDEWADVIKESRKHEE